MIEQRRSCVHFVDKRKRDTHTNELHFFLSPRLVAIQLDRMEWERNERVIDHRVYQSSGGARTSIKLDPIIVVRSLGRSYRGGARVGRNAFGCLCLISSGYDSIGFGEKRRRVVGNESAGSSANRSRRATRAELRVRALCCDPTSCDALRCDLPV